MKCLVDHGQRLGLDLRIVTSHCRVLSRVKCDPMTFKEDLFCSWLEKGLEGIGEG